MGWSIGIHKNTLLVSEDTVNKLQALFEETGEYDLEFSAIGGGSYKVEFISDYMEHMDVLWNDEIRKIIMADSENFGEVVFISAEGDNAGDIWGYRFADGKCTLLTGDIVIRDAVL